MSDFLSADINELLGGDTAVKAQESSSERSLRMNQVIAEYDKDLRNNWHPQKRRLVWPKGISK